MISFSQGLGSKVRPLLFPVIHKVLCVRPHSKHVFRLPAQFPFRGQHSTEPSWAHSWCSSSSCSGWARVLERMDSSRACVQAFHNFRVTPASWGICSLPSLAPVNCTFDHPTRASKAIGISTYRWNLQLVCLHKPYIAVLGIRVWSLPVHRPVVF